MSHTNFMNNFRRFLLYVQYEIYILLNHWIASDAKTIYVYNENQGNLPTKLYYLT